VYRAIRNLLAKGDVIHSEIPGHLGDVVMRTDRATDDMPFIQINFHEPKEDLDSMGDVIDTHTNTWFELLPEDDDKLHLGKVDDNEWVLSVMPGEEFKV
jgi:hypothetical protein